MCANKPGYSFIVFQYLPRLQQDIATAIFNQYYLGLVLESTLSHNASNDLTYVTILSDTARNLNTTILTLNNLVITTINFNINKFSTFTSTLLSDCYASAICPCYIIGCCQGNADPNNKSNSCQGHCNPGNQQSELLQCWLQPAVHNSCETSGCVGELSLSRPSEGSDCSQQNPVT